MSSSAQVSVATIENFLGSVGAGMNKSAAAPLSEAGSIGGETSHPVKSVDDRLQKAKEGERSKENEKDVKEDQGAPSVENAGSDKAASFNLLGSLAKRAGEVANPPGTADEDQLQIGTNKQPTGEDPANETNKAKAGKEDPGSSHPARTDNDSLDGHKYAYDASTPIEKMAADLKAVGEDLCAHLEVYARDSVKAAGDNRQPQGQPQRQPQQPAVKTAGALDPQLAQQAGWEIAGILNKTMDKTAADRMVRNELTSIIKEAFDDASNVAEFMNARRRKQAEDEAAEASGASGAGPGPGADGGGAGPVPGPESAGGGEGMGGMGGGAPMGGDPAGGGGGGGGGAPPTPEAVDALCQELGWDKEELLNALLADPGAGGAGGAGGMGAGAMPDPSMGAGGSADASGMGGGASAPPGMPPMPPGGGMEAQAGAGRRKQPANIKKAGFEGLKAEIRNYLTEVRQRSQR